MPAAPSGTAAAAQTAWYWLSSWSIMAGDLLAPGPAPGRPRPAPGRLRAGCPRRVRRLRGRVGPRRRACVRPPCPGDLVDDRGHAEILQDAPGRGHVPERQVAGPLGQHGGFPGI